MSMNEAAVAWGPGQPLVMEEVCVDPPQKMEVRIKILFTSICHTDLSAWKGEVYLSIYTRTIYPHFHCSLVSNLTLHIVHCC